MSQGTAATLPFEGIDITDECAREGARMHVARLEQERDALRKQVQTLRKALDYSIREWRRLKEAVEESSLYGLSFCCDEVLQKIDALAAIEEK